MKSLILFLLLACTALAQVATPNDPAFVANTDAVAAAVSAPTNYIQDWRMTNGAGTDVTAHVGPNGITDASWVAGRTGNALEFIPANSDDLTSFQVTFSTNIVTFGGWFQIHDFTGDRVLCELTANFGSAGSPAFLVYMTGSKIVTGIQSGGTFSTRDYSPPSTDTNGWHHYLFVMDNSQTPAVMEMYLDGSLATPTASTDAKTGTGNFITDYLYVGNRNQASMFFDGLCDRWYIWSGNQGAYANAIKDLTK